MQNAELARTDERVAALAGRPPVRSGVRSSITPGPQASSGKTQDLEKTAMPRRASRPLPIGAGGMMQPRMTLITRRGSESAYIRGLRGCLLPRLGRGRRKAQRPLGNSRTLVYKQVSSARKLHSIGQPGGSLPIWQWFAAARSRCLAIWLSGSAGREDRRAYAP